MAQTEAAGNGATQSGASTAKKGSVSTVGAVAIGLGGMMGAGLYTLLGLAATTAGVWIPVAFLVGGIVAGFSVYSYSKLGATFPSRGGAGVFLIRSFGDNVISGGLNVFQFLGWVIAMALYAVGFGGYAVTMLGEHAPTWAEKAFGIGLVLVAVLVNFIGAKLVSRSEMFVVAIELVIIAVFIAFAFARADYSSFAESFSSGKDSHWMGLFFAAGLLYVTYEGFGVVTNSAGNMSNPKKQLPKAMYTALALVVTIYVVVSAAVVLLLSVSKMETDQGHVLAAAAEVVMGKTGFILLSAAAMLATASAVNATLYGDANLAYMLGEKGQLPKVMRKDLWRGGTDGTLTAMVLTVLFVAFFPLSDVGQMASLAFLLIYAAVSVGHLRVRKQTGAKAWVLWTAIILNMALFALLIGYAIYKKEYGTWMTLIVAFIVSFIAEGVYRKMTGGRLRIHLGPVVNGGDSDGTSAVPASVAESAGSPAGSPSAG